ncbi:MAG: radical SAM protein [Dehalococcoidia bacterium]|nr:radical SAM protein [Dehalococcoidia bacterium]
MTWKAVKEARRRLAKEKGAIKKDWGGRLHFALVFPNSYYLGMSSLGLQTLYRHLNSYPDIVCERVFWEPRTMGDKGPLSLESQRPLGDFDVLAFSISFELDYFNVVQVLRSSGIPLIAAERNESHPLLLAGGPSVTANPEPVSIFFDCFAIGEGEAILPGFVEATAGSLEAGRHEVLEILASVPGVYVPAVFKGEPVKRVWLADLNSTRTTSVILTPDTDFSDVYLIEIARGCGRGCRFCLAGFFFRPFRYRPLESLLDQAREGLSMSKRLGLLAAAVTDHPQIDELVTVLRRAGADISVSSLRIHPLSEAVIQALAESATQTITFAPEAGSERLRRTINKCVREEDIVKAVDKAAAYGLRNIRLYFMIGLPGETDEDIAEIARLVLMLKERVAARGSRISLSIEAFVPKAGTPLQWAPMEHEEVLASRLARIRSSLSKSGIESGGESLSWSAVQGVLSRGDARLGPVLATMPRHSLAAWKTALRRHGLDTASYIYRDRLPGEPLPWSVVDSGVACGYLSDELRKASEGIETGPCPPAECARCGVC